MNMADTVIAKSDQLNADDLIGRTLTITVTKVAIPGGEQPVTINYEGDGGKPYKPGKSMRRVLMHAWGSDANAYVGRSMTLYRDDEVLFGGLKVGGIRISHMSHIDGDTTMALTATRGNKKAFKVRPLQVVTTQPSAQQKASQTIGRWVAKIMAASSEELRAFTAREDVQKYRAGLSEDLEAMMAAAITKRLEELGDLVPGEPLDQSEAA